METVPHNHRPEQPEIPRPSSGEHGSTPPIERQESATARDASQQLESIRQHIEATATRTQETRQKQSEQFNPGSASRVPAYIDRNMKLTGLKRNLARTQSSLPLPQRTFSRIIHNPVIRTVSETGSKTIARPSGLLGGGICAFAGSGLLFYLAKHIGFRYNYLFASLLFIGGFGIGLVIELILRLLSSGRRDGGSP